MPDRSVRFLPQFFAELDSQLPDERDADGSPSAADFLLYDLPSIRDLLASVPAVPIYAYLEDDDTVAVVAIDIQPVAD